MRFDQSGAAIWHSHAASELSPDYPADYSWCFARYTGMTFLPLHAYGGTVLLLFLSPSDAASVCNYLFDHLYPTDSLPPAPEDSHAS